MIKTWIEIGDARIDGVPGTAAPITINFLDAAGSVCSGLLPTGRVLDVIDGVELVGFPEHMPPHFFGITDPEDAAFTSARLGPQPWATYTQPLVLTNEAAMRAIPESHIICTSTIPGRDMARLRAASQGRVWDIDTGHDLMITEPQWTAARLEDVAATMA